MAFDAVHFFTRIIAARLAHFGGFDGLTIQNRGTGFRVFANANPNFNAQLTVQAFKGAIIAPQLKVIKNRFPRREIVRQHPPGAAALRPP